MYLEDSQGETSWRTDPRRVSERRSLDDGELRVAGNNSRHMLFKQLPWCRTLGPAPLINMTIVVSASGVDPGGSCHLVEAERARRMRRDALHLAANSI